MTHSIYIKPKLNLPSQPTLTQGVTCSFASSEKRMLERAKQYISQPHEIAQTCMPYKGIRQEAERNFKNSISLFNQL